MWENITIDGSALFQLMDCLHWQNLFVKLSAQRHLTALALATLGDMTQIGIGQGKYIRPDITGVIVYDNVLNFTNVNSA